MTGNADMNLLVTDTLKKVGVWIRKSVSVWCDQHLPHANRVDQAVDCDLWIVVPLLFNGCAKLLDIGGNWNTVIHVDPEHPKHAQMGDMSGEYAGHGRTGTFSASRNCGQILATWGRALSC